MSTKKTKLKVKKLKVVPISPRKKLHVNSLCTALDSCIDDHLENAKDIVSRAEIVGVLMMLLLDRRDL